jgi:hypothetical protein
MCAELLGMIDCLKCKFSEEDFAFDEETGEEVMSVAFDLGLETGERPIAMVFENHNGKTYIRKLIKDDEALELYKLLTE